MKSLVARGGARMRVRGLVRKEFLQIMRDPSSIAIAFLMPVLLLLLFGYGLSLDVQHVPLAVVIEQPGPDTADFVSSFQGSRYISPVFMSDLRAAERALLEGQVDGVVRLRANFAERERRASGAAVQLVVNGIDANTARLVQGYVTGVVSAWLTRYAVEHGMAPGASVEVQHRVWFNPELSSRNFLVPGLIVVIMTLIGALLTAMVMAREWERGTMEALMVTPVAAGEILLGKLIPYFVLGTGGMLFTVAMANWLFRVPLTGSFWLLFATSSLFLLVALGMGMLISSVAKSQFVAGQVALITTFLPAFLLSGFIFEIGNMPSVVQWITHLFAARYFVDIVTTLFLAGDLWAVIVPNALALAAMAVIFHGLTWINARKRLD